MNNNKMERMKELVELLSKAAYAYEQETNFRANYKPTFKGGVQ